MRGVGLMPRTENTKGKGKIFWRCTVCNDIHFGMAGPEICPTCLEKNAYVEIDESEAAKFTGL